MRAREIDSSKFVPSVPKLARDLERSKKRERELEIKKACAHSLSHSLACFHFSTFSLSFDPIRFDTDSLSAIRLTIGSSLIRRADWR